MKLILNHCFQYNFDEHQQPLKAHRTHQCASTFCRSSHKHENAFHVRVRLSVRTLNFSWICVPSSRSSEAICSSLGSSLRRDQFYLLSNLRAWVPYLQQSLGLTLPIFCRPLHLSLHTNGTLDNLGFYISSAYFARLHRFWYLIVRVLSSSNTTMKEV